MKGIRTKTSHYIEVDGVECELNHKPDISVDDILTAKVDGVGFVIGYMCYDSDVRNPFEDMECLGLFHTRLRDSSRESKEAFYAAIGRNSYGHEEEGLEADPLAVLCDVYIHSGEVWRVHNSGVNFPDERWDVSNYAGVWVPNEHIRGHIQLSALKSCGIDVDVSYVSERLEDGTVDPSRLNMIVVTLPDGSKLGGFRHWEDATEAAVAMFKDKVDAEKLQKSLREKAVEEATSSLELYNSWLSGDCWGVCIDVCDTSGNLLDDQCEATWEFIGQDESEKELKEYFDRTVENMTDGEK